MKLEGTTTIKTDDGRIDLTFTAEGVMLHLWERFYDAEADRNGERSAGSLELTWGQFGALTSAGADFRAAAATVAKAA